MGVLEARISEQKVVATSSCPPTGRPKPIRSSTAQAVHEVSVTRATAPKPRPVLSSTSSRMEETAPTRPTAATAALSSCDCARFIASDGIPFVMGRTIAEFFHHETAALPQRPYSSSTAVTGAWSEGRSQPRVSRVTSMERRVSFMPFDSQM